MRIIYLPYHLPYSLPDGLTIERSPSPTEANTHIASNRDGVRLFYLHVHMGKYRDGHVIAMRLVKGEGLRDVGWDQLHPEIQNDVRKSLFWPGNPGFTSNDERAAAAAWLIELS